MKKQTNRRDFLRGSLCLGGGLYALGGLSPMLRFANAADGAGTEDVWKIGITSSVTLAADGMYSSVSIPETQQSSTHKT